LYVTLINNLNQESCTQSPVVHLLIYYFNGVLLMTSSERHHYTFITVFHFYHIQSDASSSTMNTCNIYSWSKLTQSWQIWLRF